jgi:excisionase family DNA binding protein
MPKPPPPRSGSGKSPAARRRRPDRSKGGSHRDEFLTPIEVADRLLVAPVTVRLWASKGLLPSVTTLGGHRRFRTQDVEAFVAQHQRAPKRSGAPPSRVLIIDDDDQFARYLKGIITGSAPGVFVDVADNGFAAGVMCESMRPDVVTLDLMMPDMDGFEVCALLRSMFGKSRPRIVALTGFASRDNVKRILDAGADCCLVKSAPAEELLKELGVAHGREGA